MTDDVSEIERNPAAYLSRWTMGMLNLVIQAVQERGEAGGFCQIYQRGLDSKADGAHELTFERFGANQGRMAIAERFDSGLDGIAGFAHLEPGPPPTIYFESFWSGCRDPNSVTGAFGGTGIAMSLALKRTVTGKLRPVDGNAKMEIPGPKLPYKQNDVTEPAAGASDGGALVRARTLIADDGPVKYDLTGWSGNEVLELIEVLVQEDIPWTAVEGRLVIDSGNEATVDSLIERFE